jgi:hypothetical protein
VIQINGDNPAIVQVGATYNDLGATITGPQADLNLGITTYVNGTEMSPVQIDTTQVATDTIDYVATDQTGLTATSTRTVLIEPAAAPSIVPTDHRRHDDAVKHVKTSSRNQANVRYPPSWELKCVERVILCYATKPNMPELRASNDSASHHGER